MHWYEGSPVITEALEQLSRHERESVEELHLRVDRPVAAKGRGWQRTLKTVPGRKDCEEYLARLAGHSLYAARNNLAQGFFTLEGGCRVGFCGRAVTDGGVYVAEPMFFHIRIAREVKSAARELIPLVTCRGRAMSVLILSAPGQGKTTLLRDMLRRLSDGIGCLTHSIAVADERSEIAACVNGVPTLDVGAHTDVMDGGAKARTMEMMVRTMAPDMVAADELGRSEDAEAAAEAARMGVKVAATAHADSAAELARRPGFGRLLEQCVFERIVSLKDKRIKRVQDARGESIWEDTDEKHTDTDGVFVLRLGRDALGQ